MNRPASTSCEPGNRLAELMAALSIATDLGTGQPMEYAMTSAIVAIRLVAEIGVAAA